MLGSHQAREDLNTALGNVEVMKTTAVLLATVFDDFQTSALGTVGRCQCFEADNAVGNAVHGLVQRLGGQVVQQQYRRVVAREVMFDGQNLAPVAQRTLRQKTDFREAVDHHTGGFDALDHLEYLPRCFTQLQVRGVEQALVVIGVEQAFGRRQFEDIDMFVELPAVRGCTRAQLAFGLGQGDVQGYFARCRSGLQKLQGYGCLAGSGLSLEKKHMTA